MAEVFRLSSGRVCVLQRPSLPFLEHYHVLAFPREQGAASEEEAEEVFLRRPGAGRPRAKVAPWVA
jgi:hypothetical protein